MTNIEFANIVGKTGLLCGKPLSPEAQAEYFRLLGDLPRDVFQIAADRVILSHPWATFPSVSELRQAATSLLSSNDLTSAEAWALAREAVANIDPDMMGPHRVYRGNGEYDVYPSQAASVLKALPAPVAKAIEVFGLRELCITDSPDGVIRAQFSKVFDSLQEREKRTAMLPPIVKAAIERKRDEGMIQSALAGIGMEK